MDAALQRRSLVIGAVGLIPRFKLKGDGSIVIRVRDEMRAAMAENSYLEKAPFETVSLIFRYGHRDNLETDQYKIDKKRSCLELAIEFDGKALLELSSSDLERKFRIAIIEVLCDVAANFELPYEFLDEMRNEI